MGSFAYAKADSLSIEDQSSPTKVNIESQTSISAAEVETIQDIEQLNLMGMSMKDPIQNPSLSIQSDDNEFELPITESEALAAAENEFEKWSQDATNVEVEYHLFTNPNFQMFSPEALKTTQL